MSAAQFRDMVDDAAKDGQRFRWVLENPALAEKIFDEADRISMSTADFPVFVRRFIDQGLSAEPILAPGALFSE